jgi:hypothetical protein
MRSFMIFLCVCEALVFLSSGASGYDPEKIAPTSAAERCVEPFYFIDDIKVVFALYYEKHGTYPSRWDDVITSFDIRITKLVRLDTRGKQLWIRGKRGTSYTIIVSGTGNYLVLSSPDNSHTQWACDASGKWISFPSPEDEAAQIEKRIAAYRESFPESRMSYLTGNWHYRNPAAYGFLLDIALDNTGSTDLRERAIDIIIADIPNLTRFQWSIRAINKTIDARKDLADKDDIRLTGKFVRLKQMIEADR